MLCFNWQRIGVKKKVKLVNQIYITLLSSCLNKPAETKIWSIRCLNRNPKSSLLERLVKRTIDWKTTKPRNQIGALFLFATSGSFLRSSIRLSQVLIPATISYHKTK